MQISTLNETLSDATMVYVTHDQDEAMTLADRIVVLSENGSIEQIGEPEQLYASPNNLFVATFIGSTPMNIFPASVTGTGHHTLVATSGLQNCRVNISTGESYKGNKVMLGIRPEHIQIDPTDNKQTINGTISHIERLGSHSLLYVNIQDDSPWCIVKSPGTTHRNSGDSIQLGIPPERLYLFNSEGKGLR